MCSQKKFEKNEKYISEVIMLCRREIENFEKIELILKIH
jgi:hypothetical protein